MQDDKTETSVAGEDTRVVLVPQPSDSPEDPLNWPSWRKHALLFVVSFHAFLAIFAASIIIAAYVHIAEDFNISLTKATYLTGVQILFLGISPLFWAPLSSRYGRRPIYLFSTISAAGCSLAGAYCTSYGALMTTRVFQAICISPPMAIGAATIKEMFFRHELGQKMGVWTLFVTLSIPVAPLIGGFLVHAKGWPWIFYLITILDLAAFAGYLFLGPETLYLRDRPAPAPRSRWRFGRIDARPLAAREFVAPLLLARRLPLLLCALAYTVAFAYCAVLLTVLVPQLFGGKFGLHSAQIGLQFVSLIVGAVLGEQLAGPGSDWLVRWRERRAGRREPEMRLRASWPGFVIGAVGVIVWGVQLQNAKPGEWNVTPDIGSGIAIFGLQLVTTPLYTYCVEAYPGHAADVSVFILVMRQVFGFLAPFYLSDGAVNLGPAKFGGMCGAFVGASITLVWAVELYGKKWRERDAEEEEKAREEMEKA